MQALLYLRDPSGATASSDPTVEQQQLSCERFCARADIEVAGAFRESSDVESETFRTLVRDAASEGDETPLLIVAQWLVLGDGARAQARRYLQLRALDLDVRLADGCDPDAELVRAWRERGSHERRAERSREAMRTRALRGEALGRPPYGYRVEERKLTPEPDEAVIVREMFRACIEDHAGIRRIAQQLNAAGHRTRRGRPWATASVREILRNPVYTGTYRRMGIVVPGAHTALMPRGEFARAQRLIDQRRTSPTRQRRHAYLLSGLATCGYCGNRLIGVRRRRQTEAGDGPGEYVYYQCESRTNQGRCGYHTRRADELERAVGDAVAALPLSLTTTAPVPEESDASLTKQHRSRERTLERMLDRRASGQWTAAQLRKAAAPGVLADLDAERRAGGQADGARPTAAEARAALAGGWDGFSFEQRRSLLQRALSAVVVTDDRVELRPAG
jgi:site-specific DNA recombinase